MYTDLRLKIIRFFKKNMKIIFIAVSIWIVIFIINKFLKNYQPKKERQTTYKPTQSVMEPSKKVSKNINESIESLIKEYVGYCNDAEWEKAFNMLSDTCKRYSFQDDIKTYMDYVYTKMPTPKEYVIQDYSNEGNTYIYQVKYLDDILATGLTNTTYQYTEEKMIFKKVDPKNIEMSVGNFIDYEEIKNISEDEYLKVDVKSVVKYYSMEEYTVKITNRSDYTIVVSDNQCSKEVYLKMNGGEIRSAINIQNIVLEPKESITTTFKFQKFYDGNDDSQSFNLGEVRVMENYSGTEGVLKEVIQSEIQNAIAKFSVTVPVN